MPINGLAAPDLRTVGDDADGSLHGDGSTVRTNPLEVKGETDADGADANSQPGSAPEEGDTPAWRARL
jgi:hypothetical protein